MLQKQDLKKKKKAMQKISEKIFYGKMYEWE